MSCIKYNQKGFAAFFITFLILAVIFSITISIAILTVGQEKIARNIVRSSRAYYVAEAGIEDAVYRIKNSLNVPSNYTLTVGDDSVDIIVDSPNSKTRIITASSNVNNVFRRLETYLSVNTVTPQFFYGVQAGDLGIRMEENSYVQGTGGAAGNVYSNGTINGDNKAKITGNAFVAAGASLNYVSVLGDAHANTINNSEICGDAYYQNIDASSLNFLNKPKDPPCPTPLTNGFANSSEPDPPLEDMPISDSNINQWKDDATEGGVYSGNFTIDSPTDFTSLGPKKIDGNLVFGKTGQTLNVTGTIYVTGYIDINKSNLTIQCDPAYGLNSCIILADKWIAVKNNAIFSGAIPGNSYILFLSNSNCNGSSPTDCSTGNSAIYLKNNAIGAIFYAGNGLVYIENGVNATELTGRKIHLSQGAFVSYETGLINVGFSSGPGGGWQIDSWKEVE